MRICFTQLSGFLNQISHNKTILVSSQRINVIRKGFALFYGDKFNLIVVGGSGRSGYCLECKGRHRDSWFGRRSFAMIVTTKQNDRWSRKVVHWRHPELRNISKGPSQTENQASTRISTVPVERKLINAELNALLRWEDDGGQPT